MARLVRREASTGRPPFLSEAPTALCCSGPEVQDIYFEKIRVFKAGRRLNTLAWNDGRGPRSRFVGFLDRIMIKRDSWGHSYLIVRGKILGFMKDE